MRCVIIRLEARAQAPVSEPLKMRSKFKNCKFSLVRKGRSIVMHQPADWPRPFACGGAVQLKNAAAHCPESIQRPRVTWVAPANGGEAETFVECCALAGSQSVREPRLCGRMS